MDSPNFSLNRALTASAVLLCFAAPASAQNDMTLAPSPALACLTIPGGAPLKPDYPADALKLKEGGSVKVQLEFRAPGDRPRVTVLERANFRDLNDAVEDHVKQFRVPCMQEANGPVTLVQAYVFDADGASRVMAAPTRDTADVQRAAQLKCMRHRFPNSKPYYPRNALQRGDEGTMIVKLHFRARDQAPAVEFVGGSDNRALRGSVQSYAEDLRLPCLDDKPVDVMIAYRFVINGSQRTLLRDGDLAEVLSVAKDLPHPAYFDFNAMVCPFDVRLTYHRPYSTNKLEQLDTAVPARQPLLDWLEGMTLRLDAEKSARVFGNKMIITVPCGKLDI